jgi:hypothetical protein
LLSVTAFETGWRALCLALLLSFNSSAQISIQSYDTPSCIDFESVEVVTSESATNAIIHLFRTGEFRVMSRIDFQTVEESASEGKDYAGTGGTLVFQPGEGYKTISIPILADNLAESSETFSIVLSATDTNNIIVHQSARITIQDSSARIESIPRLAIEVSGDGSAVLTWPSSAGQFVLETAPTCSDKWEPVAIEPVLNGNRYEVAQALTNGLALFRLTSKPSGF